MIVLCRCQVSGEQKHCFDEWGTEEITSGEATSGFVAYHFGEITSFGLYY
jgi:hypothetical protein